MPFIVEHSTEDAWRSWGDFGPIWVRDPKEAIQYARRADAERVHAEDLDAGFIRETAEDGELIPRGPFGIMQVDGGARWAVIRTQGETGQVLTLLTIKEGFTEQEAELAAVICASALNRMLPKFEAMRQKAADAVDKWTSDFLSGRPGQPTGGLLANADKPLTHPAVEVLHIFHEFVLKNATQWKLGAYDHHHPVWEMTAEVLNGRVPITEGVDWAFIQPENRLKLDALRAHKNKIELKDGQ